MLTLLAIAYAAMTLWSVVALHRAYAALARDGRPMTPADLQPAPIPDSDNAAPLYEKALTLLEMATIGDQKLIDRLRDETLLLGRTNLTVAAFAGFREAMQMPAAVAAMELIVEAAQRPDCQLAPVAHPECSDLDAITDGTTQPMMALFQLNRIVSWEVRRLAAEGEIAAARRLLLAQMRLSGARPATPVLVDGHLAAANRLTALRTLQKMCELSPPSTNETAVLLSELARFNIPDLVVRAIDGERLLVGEPIFRTGVSRGIVWQDHGRCRCLRDAVCYSCLNARLIHTDYLHAMRRLATEPLDRAMAKKTIPPRGDLTWRLTTPFVAHLAEVRCTEAGLAVLAHKQELGSWPEKLATCMAAVPVDPSDGQPLHYQATEKGFVVSSRVKIGRPSRRRPVAWEYVVRGQ